MENKANIDQTVYKCEMCDYYKKYGPESIGGARQYCGKNNREILEPDKFQQWCPLCKEDQTAKADQGKAQLRLVPRKILFDIARIREYGTKKYKDPDNWKRVEKWRYQDAMMRHMCAYLDDPEGVDEESGLPHLWHLACNVAFLCEMENEKI